MITLRRAASIALAASVVFLPAACSDEDGDGATTDEEVDQIDETGEDVTDEVGDEVREGADEVDDGE